METHTSITASKKFDSDADTSDFGLDEPQNVVKLSTATRHIPLQSVRKTLCLVSTISR
ncbi:MAG: hypothetical protein ACLRI8_03410 [Agathobacter rectalis]